MTYDACYPANNAADEEAFIKLVLTQYPNAEAYFTGSYAFVKERKLIVGHGLSLSGAWLDAASRIQKRLGPYPS